MFVNEMQAALLRREADFVTVGDKAVVLIAPKISVSTIFEFVQ